MHYQKFKTKEEIEEESKQKKNDNKENKLGANMAKMNGADKSQEEIYIPANTLLEEIQEKVANAFAIGVNKNKSNKKKKVKQMAGYLVGCFGKTKIKKEEHEEKNKSFKKLSKDQEHKTINKWMEDRMVHRNSNSNITSKDSPKTGSNFNTITKLSTTTKTEMNRIKALKWGYQYDE